MDLFFASSTFGWTPFLDFSGEEIGEGLLGAIFFDAAREGFFLTGETVVEVLPSSVISRWSPVFVVVDEGSSKSASLSSERTRVDRRCRLAGRGAMSEHGVSSVLTSMLSRKVITQSALRERFQFLNTNG